MIGCWVEGIGIYGPGLTGWEAAASVLRGEAAHQPGESPKLAPALLPADVRRRTTEHIKLAVEVASQAVSHAATDGAPLWSVFASSESDGAITHNICEEVARDVPEVSPTRFHNSVNNAPAGYWCMAVRSHAPSTSVAGFDATFAVGLLEAGVQVAVANQAVLCVAHDTPLPEPLHSVRPMSAIFGIALVLRPERSARSLARLALAIEPALIAPTRLGDTGLEGLRTGNPAARGLPVLAAIARRAAQEVLLPYVHSQTLRVVVEPA
jgi:hypothetical protein